MRIELKCYKKKIENFFFLIYKKKVEFLSQKSPKATRKRDFLIYGNKVIILRD